MLQQLITIHAPSTQLGLSLRASETGRRLDDYGNYQRQHTNGGAQVGEPLDGYKEKDGYEDRLKEEVEHAPEIQSGGGLLR
jgi:hypothetical protein